MRSLLLLTCLLALALSSACLVLSLHPAYDGDSIDWEPGLIGTWLDREDRMSLQVQADEWRSYRIHYEHPSEKGDLTAYVTIVSEQHYLDVLPLRGQDYGSFLLPLHGVVRIELTGDTLVLTPLSYDWFSDRLRARQSTGVASVFDQKQNALITAPTARFRSWLRALPTTSPAWGASATFTRQ